MSTLILLLHNIRSIHNVGSIMRTAEGFGIKKIICSGYTPYPKIKNDTRLPHIVQKIETSLHKTALGAEKILSVAYHENPVAVINDYHELGYQIIALEQNSRSQNLRQYSSNQNKLIILGEEVNGIESQLLEKADIILEIPMFGKKESFNVSVAAGICLYQLTA